MNSDHFTTCCSDRLLKSSSIETDLFSAVIARIQVKAIYREKETSAVVNDYGVFILSCLLRVSNHLPMLLVGFLSERKGSLFSGPPQILQTLFIFESSKMDHLTWVQESSFMAILHNMTCFIICVYC